MGDMFMVIFAVVVVLYTLWDEEMRERKAHHRFDGVDRLTKPGERWDNRSGR